MATKVLQQTGGVINSADTYVLGNAADGVVGTIVVQGVSDSFVGTLVVKGRVKGSGAAFVEIPYTRRNLAGTVSDDTSVVADLTDSFLIAVDAAGLDVALDCTAYTSGSLTAYPIALRG